MSDYPSTSPFGPHGPQTNGYSVTPNPTAQSSFPNIGGGDSYAGYSQPSGGGYVGGGYAGGSVYVPTGPPIKFITLGVILAWLLGPIGMLYAVRGSALHWIAFLLYTALYTYAMYITDTAQPVWLTLAMVNAVWAGIAIRRYNTRVKREWNA